jgi:hypothetical protein
VPKNDHVVPTEKIAEDRAMETWDGEGGGGAARRPDGERASLLPRQAPQASRPVSERRRGDRRR